MSEHSRRRLNAPEPDEKGVEPHFSGARPTTAPSDAPEKCGSTPFSCSGELTAGVDEVGRGPLAGPVVAAAVILDPAREIEGLCDSKRLGAAQRAQLARAIRHRALAAALGAATEAEIDTLNILEASLLAMERAVRRLTFAPTRLIVDGRELPRFADGPSALSIEGVIGGDATEPAISAASIVAKDFRDRFMLRAHRRWPGYGFDRHKGYPTRAHIVALGEHGPCEIHRASFGPVGRYRVER